MLYDFNESYKQKAIIKLEDSREIEGWFLDGCRIEPNTIPENHYWYQTRHGDSDWSTPLSIVQGGVLVNFCGTFVCDVDLELNEETEILEFDLLCE